MFIELFFKLQLKLSLIYFDTKKGDIIKAGMTIKRKTVWNGVSVDIAKPDPKPASNEIKDTLTKVEI